jgi:hypothetical protein
MMAEASSFLEGIPLRPVKLAGSSFEPLGLALGRGSSALEVVVARSRGEPGKPALRSAWKARKGGRAAPLLLVVLYDGRASLCGPSGEDAPAYVDLDPGQVERICREALEQPDRHAALRALRDSLPAVESRLGGIRNEGFLATHELEYGARQRTDWLEAGEKARRILKRRGQDLLKGLGFEIEPCDQVTSILRAGERKVAVAVLLRQEESPDLRTERFSNLSPVSYALAVADRENLPYVVIQHGPKIRVHPVAVGIGVGRRGRTETYVQCHVGHLRDADAAYLWLLCSADALKDGGTLEELLKESDRFAGELAKQLRERVYESVVPRLAEGIVAARGLKRPTAQDLAETYQMAMLVLFRLLFVAYAEDKDLLPYKWNGLYQRRSLKTKAQELLEFVRASAEGDGLWDRAETHWEEIRRLFRAVDEGTREWGVPSYNGGLFSEDPEVSRIGALLSEITLPNTVLGPALRDLFLVESPEGLGVVDFRSLGVREFGTVYEGLLESELSVAETDLALDEEGIYRPAGKSEQPEVKSGEVYLHNASGARKATGSYFTKHFAVEHLLDRSLEPALDEHFARLDELNDEAAGEAFFDFRVADIAMGSGHFLVAAIDHIERRLTGYLSKRKLPRVSEELATLRAAALDALGPLADQVEIEDAQLLRRLIARRCIYGVDINPTAVQLARLGIWIHTFVPGLPLSLLDHNLVEGNSLVGIAKVEEVEEKVHEDLGFLKLSIETLLGEADEHLRRLARIADATPADLARARKAAEEAHNALVPAAALFDIVTACRIKGEPIPVDVGQWDTLRDRIVDSKEHNAAREALGELRPSHFPIAFPEVFLRERAGFDVIIGNPPWQEATVEEDAFWARHSPGLRSLAQVEQEAQKARLRTERPDLVVLYERELAEAEALRRALTSGAFPGMGTGDPDLYKAFCWRFWSLITVDGRLGVVLPRSALAAKGSTPFRREIFGHSEGVDITALLNRGGWVFDDAEHRYTIGLVGIEKGEAVQTPVAVRGPYASPEGYGAGVIKEPTVFYGSEIEEWNDTASLPLLPTDESVEVFEQLRKAPRLDLNDGRSWRARPHTELHATNDKQHMDLKSKACPKGYWPVYKGESFDLWNPDTGVYYAWADPETMRQVLQEKRRRGGRNRRSPFSEFHERWLSKPSTLPCLTPRLAFRDVTRATDTRTVRLTLIPPNVFITNKGPYLLWPRGDERDQAYLLGVLASLPLDWYARRFVEINLNFFVFNPMPVPRPGPDSALRARAVALAGRLACPERRFAKWAEAVGVDYGPLEEDEKEDMIHELDAVVAHLYGLEEGHLVHIFETFHEGWDYEERLRDTLRHFTDWRKRL